MGQSRRAAAERELGERFGAAVDALGGGDPTAALTAVGLAEAALANLVDPDPVDRFNVALLRVRGLRLADRHDEAGRAAGELAAGLAAADPGSLPDGWRLHVQIQLEWGDALRCAGRYPEALPHLQDGLAIAIRELGADDTDTGSACNSLGMLHRYQGDFDAALTAYRRALQIVETIDGPDCLDAASILHNIASLHQTRGDAAAAEPPARRALRIRRECLGPSHPDVAADFGVLGVVLADLGRFDDPADCYRAARSVFADPRAPRPAELAYLACNEAALFHLRGDLDAADNAYRDAQQRCAAELGARHPQVAAVLLNRATLALDQGRLDLADEFAGQVESLLSGVVADDHPHLVAARSVRRDAAQPALR